MPDEPETEDPLQVHPIRLSQNAADQIESEHQRLQETAGTAIADTWEDSLMDALGSLATYPHRCAVAIEDSLFTEGTLRQLLFRRTKNSAQLSALKPPITEEEFMRLPRDGRKYEFVDGRLLEAPTSFEHDTIGSFIIFYLMSQLWDQGAVTTGQAGFRMADGNIRIPDVSFTPNDRLPGGKVPAQMGMGAPGLCVEIISPSEEPADMRRKLENYFASGARLWHVFPAQREVTVYTAPTETVTLSETDELTGGDVLPSFRCRVSALFGPERPA
jgi:Uma2 family endonuclease/plasmid stabilization system protein ParE